MNTTSPLTALEVCQVLTDVALGERIITRSSMQSWSEIYHGLMPVEIGDWHHGNSKPNWASTDRSSALSFFTAHISICWGLELAT
ncbi:DUF7693 family protein [Pseudomonas farris]|uniref:DUF7693 family protein n=1 Tax=Pseudomonas farris TaxID=2841207 RepID=UPI003F5A0890